MTNLRKRLAFIAIGLAAVSGGATALGACSSTEDTPKNDGGTPEGGGTDSPSGSETGTDGGTDTGADTFVPVEAGTIAEFITLNGQTTCNRLRDCCGGPTKFDLAKCNADFANGGWANSTRDLNVTGVATGGKVTYDPVAGSACLTAVANLTCNNTPVAEYKNANEKCFEAAVGTVALNGACKSNAECVKTAFCDPGTNVCTALKTAGAACNEDLGECAYREAAGANRCFDHGTGSPTCGPSIANGQACANTDFDCQSGSCYYDPDGGTGTCETKVGFIADSCRYYALGDGG